MGFGRGGLGACFKHAGVTSTIVIAACLKPQSSYLVVIMDIEPMACKYAMISILNWHRQRSGVRHLLAPMAGLAGDLSELSFFEVFEDFAIDFLRHGDHESRDVFAGIFV